MKITLSNVGILIDTMTAQTTINNNFETIQTAFDDTLSRDGTVPIFMDSLLVMNSNQIINLPSPISPQSPLRLKDANILNGGGTINSIPTGGTTGQVLTKNSNTSCDASWDTIPEQLPTGGISGKVLAKKRKTNFYFS